VAAFIGLATWQGEAPAAAQVPTVPGHECDKVPSCVVQTMETFTLTGWGSASKDFYCTGEHPYFWAFSYTQTGYPSVSNIASSSSGDPDWVRILFTNWNPFQTDQVIVTLGCSKDSQWGHCGPGGSNPGCPEVPGSAKVYCNHVRGVPLCIHTFNERCPQTGQLYTCTMGPLIPVAWCQACPG
jgi:hypothetical protein